MTEHTNKEVEESIEGQKDFYKSELLKKGYFKTPGGRQLYELSLYELKQIYWNLEVKN